VTFLLARLAAGAAPEQRLLLILGGTGIRMMAVLLAVMVLFGTSYFNSLAFALWVLVFYLGTLALEVALLLLEGASPRVTSPGLLQDAIHEN
jgi:hypothetical protein